MKSHCKITARGIALGCAALILLLVGSLLGDGELKKKLTVQVHKYSASAKTGIEKAGGSCEVVTS